MDVVIFALKLLAGCIIVTPFAVGAGYVLIDYWHKQEKKYDLQVINAIAETVRDMKMRK